MHVSRSSRNRLAARLLALAVFVAPVLVRAGPSDQASCDRLAAVPFDADKPSDVGGVDEIADADSLEALRSCEAATRASDAPRRIWMQYGRALETSGKSAEAIAAYEKAASQGQGREGKRRGLP
jgi:hypothetical protein